MRSAMTFVLVGLMSFCCGCPLGAAITPRQACLSAGLSDAETDELIDQVGNLAAEVGTLSRSEWTEFVDSLCLSTNCTDAEFTCLFRVGLQEIVE